MTQESTSVRDQLQAQLAALRARQLECGGATAAWRASLAESTVEAGRVESTSGATSLGTRPDAAHATEPAQREPGLGPASAGSTLGTGRAQEGASRRARGAAVARIARRGSAGSISDRRALRLALSSEAELIAAVEDHTRARSKHEKRLVFTLAELLSRGTDLPGGLSPVDWLRTVDAAMSTASAAAITRVARAMGETWWRSRGLTESLSGQTARGSSDGLATPPPEGAASRPVGVGHAMVVVDFAEKVRRVGEEGEVDDAIEHLWWEARHGVSQEQLAKLARELTAQIQPPADQDSQAERQLASRELHLRRPDRCGMTRIEGRLDPEGAALLGAALDALAAPTPDRESGELDIRSPGRRRADALVELVRRGTAGSDVGRSRVVVTIDADVLAGRTPGAGVSLQGVVLSPGVVRKMACDAGVLPMVLGSDSAPLDVGRTTRLVAPALRTALWHRDRHCSFPGCSVPATWCDAHHVVHWCHDGPTSLDNLALLCGRHHSWVHTHRLHASIGSDGVTWHGRHGSGALPAGVDP